MLGLLRDLSLKIKTQAAVEADARNAAFLVVVVLRHRVVHRTEPCAVSSDAGDGYIYVIVSRRKERIEIIRIEIDALQ